MSSGSWIAPYSGPTERRAASSRGLTPPARTASNVCPMDQHPWRLGPRGRRWLDRAVVAFVLLVGGVGHVAAGQPVATVFTVVEVLPLLWRRRHPWPVFLVVAVASALQAVAWDEPAVGQLAFPVAVYSVARWSPRWQGVTALLIGYAGALVAATRWLFGFGAGDLSASNLAPYTVTIGAVVTAAWALGWAAQSRERYVASLVARAEQAERRSPRCGGCWGCSARATPAWPRSPAWTTYATSSTRPAPPACGSRPTSRIPHRPCPTASGWRPTGSCRRPSPTCASTPGRTPRWTCASPSTGASPSTCATTGGARPPAPKVVVSDWSGCASARPSTAGPWRQDQRRVAGSRCLRGCRCERDGRSRGPRRTDPGLPRRRPADGARRLPDARRQPGRHGGRRGGRRRRRGARAARGHGRRRRADGSADAGRRRRRGDTSAAR